LNQRLFSEAYFYAIGRSPLLVPLPSCTASSVASKAHLLREDIDGLDVWVAPIVQQQSFDVIHFNNGLHGRDYTPEQYSSSLPALLAVFQRYALAAKLVWASSTDVRQKDHLDQARPETERVAQRNAAAARIRMKKNIPIDDLFAAAEAHREYHLDVGVHCNEEGYAILDSPGFRALASPSGMMPRKATWRG
jgi:hypothetical protein